MQFTITNITCDACVTLSTRSLKSIPGVREVTIDLASGKTDVTSDVPLAWNDVVSALSAVGKTAVQNS